MEIKVLGPGCPNCSMMEELVKKAVKEIGIEVKIYKITDIVEIMKYTMSTPALVINENSSIPENLYQVLRR